MFIFIHHWLTKVKKAIQKKRRRRMKGAVYVLEYLIKLSFKTLQNINVSSGCFDMPQHSVNHHIRGNIASLKVDLSQLQEGLICNPRWPFYMVIQVISAHYTTCGVSCGSGHRVMNENHREPAAIVDDFGVDIFSKIVDHSGIFRQNFDRKSGICFSTKAR